MKNEKGNFIGKLADKTANQFENHLDDMIKKMDAVFENAKTKEEAVEGLLKTGYWMRSKEELEKLIN
jgi:hypothetical protein